MGPILGNWPQARVALCRHDPGMSCRKMPRTMYLNYNAGNSQDASEAVCCADPKGNDDSLTTLESREASLNLGGHLKTGHLWSV